MFVYQIYREFSDFHNQDFKEYGLYSNRGKATNALKDIIIKEQKDDVDYNQLEKLDKEEIYDVEYIGFYGIKEISIID